MTLSILERATSQEISRAEPADATPARPLVEVRGLNVRFNGRRRSVHAVRGLDLAIYPGEVVAIVGESGSGKSVTARSLTGLAGDNSTVEANLFTVAGKNALQFKERQWRQVRGRHVGLVLQDALVSLDPLRKIEAEVAEPILTHGLAKRREVPGKVRSLLASVGIDDPEVRAKQYPHELSGGLRQRALIASAIAGEPELIIADEPTTALDVTVQAQVINLLKARRDAGTALLIISHDLAVVSGIADRILVMKDGEIVEQGSAAEVLGNAKNPYTKALLAAVPSRDLGREVAGTADGGGATGERALQVQTTGLSKSFSAPGGKRRLAVRGVDFQLLRGEKLGIVGESGSGKSTLVRLILGLIEPDAGEVEIDGFGWHQARSRAQTRELRKKIQFVAQDPAGSFDPRYTVEEIIKEPLRGNGYSAERIDARVSELLELTALTADLLPAHPRELSGGQRQRVSIARALALDPDVLVCDEPVSALDVSVQAQILDLLADLSQRTGTSLIFISHDLAVVHQLVDRVIVMKDGEIVESGPVDTVFDSPGHPYTTKLMAAIPRLRA
ncbi:MAG: dipeptide ABC transporter ATP-binding protein [Ancrocorticia sp.]|uniref:dipeptide ABC transporter ATP-binding protein n=1 Tax=Ancrocorticia sp. TaxID=2593684 RepID=UPI003F91725E